MAVRIISAPATLDSAVCIESETARPATLKIASRELVSMPSVPATSMTAIKIRTALAVVRRKPKMVWSSFECENSLSAAFRISRISTAHKTSRTAAYSSFCSVSFEKNDSTCFSSMAAESRTEEKNIKPPVRYG